MTYNKPIKSIEVKTKANTTSTTSQTSNKSKYCG